LRRGKEGEERKWKEKRAERKSEKKWSKNIPPPLAEAWIRQCLVAKYYLNSQHMQMFLTNNNLSKYCTIM